MRSAQHHRSPSRFILGATLAVVAVVPVTSSCSGEDTPGGPGGSVPNGNGDDQGTVAWNDGAVGSSADGLMVAGFSGYDVAFAGKEDPEVLRFTFGSMVAGEHDLAGTDGQLVFKVNYRSTQEGGWARVQLTDLGDNRIEASFSSRTCFKDTPNANCFEQRNGSFNVVNNTGEPLRPLNPVEIAPGFPILDALTQTRAEWPTTEGIATGRAGGGVRFAAGSYLLQFNRPSWVTRGSFSLRLPNLDVGLHTFDSSTKVNYSSGGTYAHVSDIDGGGGEVDIIGNNGQAIWGTLQATLCFSQTPRFNCIEFQDVRFTAAIEP